MLSGTLVMIAGFIPVGFASSSAGEYCFSLFAVVLMALLNSWVVAILFSPLTGTWLLPEKLKHRAAGPGLHGAGDMDDFCVRYCATACHPWDCAGRAGTVGVRDHVYAGGVFPFI